MNSLAAMRTFVTVVHCGNFTDAAEQLGTSPSTVSKQIAALERSLGTRLLDRTTRRVSVTEIGEVYFASCEDILGSMADLEEEISQLQANERGRVTIRIPHSIAILYLGGLVREFCAQFSDISVDIVIDEYPLHSLERVERSCDIAFNLGPVASTALVVKELTRVNWSPYAAPSYLERFGTPAHPGELLRHRCLSHLAVASNGRWSFEGPDGETTVKVSGPLAAGSAIILKDATLDGLGIALLPAFVLTREERERLVRVMPGYHGPRRHLYAAYNANRRMPRRNRLLLDFVHDRLRLPPWETR